MGNVDFAARLRSGAGQNANNLRRWHALGNLVYAGISQDAVGADDEHRRHGDAAFVSRVIDIPILNDPPLRIA